MYCFMARQAWEKTTLASIIANEMGVNMRQTTGPAFEHQGDLAACFQPQEGDVVYRYSSAKQCSGGKALYCHGGFYAGYHHWQRPERAEQCVANPVYPGRRYDTSGHVLSKPAGDRFGVINRLELYNDEELQRIVERMPE